MKLKSKILLSVAIFGFGAFSWASSSSKLKEAAQKMMPGSQLVLEDGNEFSFQTAKGTIVEVELNRDGSVDEVSGDAVINGDVFTPDGGLMSLTDAVSALQKAGKNPVGDWSFEKSLLHGWIYEFDGIENGKKMKYAIDAKSGKLVKDRRDF